MKLQRMSEPRNWDQADDDDDDDDNDDDDDYHGL